VPRLAPGADAGVVLSFGANDTTVQDGPPRVSPEHSSVALAAILTGTASLGLSALMVGPAPVDDLEQNERIRNLSGAFADVCARSGAAFVSIVEPLLASRVWMTQVAAGDGARPAAEGYKVLSDVVIAAGWADWLGGT
jgi:acyl-CoA thioesterase I